MLDDSKTIQLFNKTSTIDVSQMNTSFLPEDDKLPPTAVYPEPSITNHVEPPFLAPGKSILKVKASSISNPDNAQLVNGTAFSLSKGTSDTEVVFGGRIYGINKGIFASQSRVFASIFRWVCLKSQSQLKFIRIYYSEPNEFIPPRYELPNTQHITMECFQQFIIYMYHGQVNKLPQFAVPLLALAEKVRNSFSN